MIEAEPNDVPATSSSRASILPPSQGPPAISQETQKLGAETAGAHVEASAHEEIQSDSPQPKAAAEEADDDVLFISSAPRTKKQWCWRPNSIGMSSGIVEAVEHPDLPLALDTTTRRGTTGMVQGLAGCYIEDNQSDATKLRGSSLPAVPPVVVQQTQDLQFQPIDPTTEPNFVAMQDIPLPDSCLQWWNEPVSGIQPQQTTLSSWMDFQNEDTSSRGHCGDIYSAETRPDTVDAQISPRTKPATTLPSNSIPKDSRTEARELARRMNDSMRFQPDMYYSSTSMPSWSKSWTSSANHGSTHPRPARIPSSTPLSLIRNNFSSKLQQAQQAHSTPQPQYYPSRYTEAPQRLFTGKANQIFQSSSGFKSTAGAGGFRGIATSRSDGVFPSSQQQSRLSTNQMSNNIRTSSKTPGGEPIRNNNQQRLPPSRIDNPNDVLRKPSLYKIPPWNSLSRPGNLVVPSSHNPNGNMTADLRTDYQSHGSKNVHASSSQNPQALQHASESEFIRRQRTRKHSPNLIVDIAETCQQLFPFELVAERHSMPIQKVFDAFSAIIQLPLLRNADDKRRHGSLGKQRMRDFREAKKAMMEDRRGVKRSAENSASVASGAKRMRLTEENNERPLLKHAALSNSWERGTFRS